MNRLFRFRRFARAAFRRLSTFAAVALACGAVSTLGGGCASAYWRDRANDLGDIASVSFGAGLGVRAQAGPLAAGLGAQMDVAGFRGGRFFFDRRAFDLEPIGWSVDLLCVSGNLYGCRPTDLVEPYDRTTNARGKYQGQYSPLVEGVFVPFWLCGEMLELSYYEGSRHDNPPQALAPCQTKEGLPFLPTWTHIEVAAALGVGVRLGFNPGELLDFLLGFFGFDLYGDDLARGDTTRAEPEPHAESAEFAEDVAFLAIGIAKGNVGKTLGFRQAPPEGWPRTFKTDYLLFARVPTGSSNLWVSVFETTNAQWENITGSPSPSFFTNSAWKATRPVESVNADQISNGFLPVLNGRPDGWRFRLPTEDEWNLYSQDLSSQVPEPSQERCNDGSLETGYWDPDKSLFGMLFEYNDAKKTRYYRNCPPSKSGPTAVGSYPPNRWGLHDLRGNVAEWCASETNGFAAVRGGCWLYLPEHCIVETRAYIPKDMTHHTKCDLGFRLVADKR